jgi:tetratricopeptide (TPR) repeat protein
VHKAIDFMRMAIRWAPKDPDMHCDLAQMYFETGKYKDAEASFRTALNYKYDYRRALKGVGFALQEQGNQSEAVYFYLRYLREESKDPDVLLNLGAALHDIGKYEEALHYYSQARTYDPANAIILENTARSLYSLGRLDEAIANVRKAIEINPKNADAYKLLGLCLESKGAREEALACYERAVDDQVPDGDLRLQLADLLDRLGRYEDSLEHALHARDIFEAAQDRGGMARAYWDVGWAYYRLKQWKHSIDASRRAVELWPDLYQARFNLALALLQDDQQQEALREYLRGAEGLAAGEIKYWAIDDLEEALEQSSDSRPINEALKLLKDKSKVRPADADGPIRGEENTGTKS